ncbi:SDR family oxidoreductase [Polaromonas sp.]|jgi:NAD(P)-dependent dehydrogenase (short-subunit alcohol dehydrogenase family)|uniref:SDR family oxidoreductase n=1 Tax=Polaromonas sp. TaxID=1869339 RepID=UPI001A2BD3C2|nr:SDR family oxidoreductase [Burkholderiales bacterium]
MKRTALVTGGGKRIGRAICLRLASEGYGVVIHYLNSEVDAKKTRDDCLEAGASMARIICSDLSNPQDRSVLIDRATEMAGPVNLLVNSASLFNYDDAKMFSQERLEDHLQTNYLAPVELTMAMHRIASHSKLDSLSHVVTLLDQKLFNLNTDYMTYTLAKLACHSSIRYLAQCCAPVLRVNAIAPGITFVSGEMNPEEFNKAHRIAALGQSNTADDIAASVLLLDRVSSITGQTIIVDGGQHLIPRARDVAFEEP